METKPMASNEAGAKFFVMIRHQKGHPMVMVDEQEDVELFDGREEAESAGKKNLFGETFGFEVYEW